MAFICLGTTYLAFTKVKGHLKIKIYVVTLILQRSMGIRQVLSINKSFDKSEYEISISHFVISSWGG